MANEEFNIPDYGVGKSVNANMTRSSSLLHDFPFTDSLTFDQQFEAADAQTVQTGGLFRTSRGPNRTQLSSRNELGAEQGGVYIYVNNIIRTAFTEDTIFFYDLTGAVSSVIQQPSPGVLSLSATTINLIGNVVFGGGTSFASDLLPDTDNAYDIGSATFAWKDLYMKGNALIDGYTATDHLGIADGITAPSTVSGVAWIYVDTADGDLKVKFGDGTVKTIVTD